MLSFSFPACNDIYTVLDTDEELSSPSSIPESITSVQSVRAVSDSSTKDNVHQENEKAEASGSVHKQDQTRPDKS